MFVNEIGRPFGLFGYLFSGTAYSEAAKLLLVGRLNCNWEITSAGCPWFVCWPTSLLPAFSIFLGIYTCSFGSRELQLRQHALYLGEKGITNQGLGPALPVHLA